MAPYTTMDGLYERPEGVTDKEWRDFLAEIERDEECIRKRVCPVCESPITKKLDPRQAGGSLTNGAWFNYRCTNPAGCTFLMDQIEGD